MLFFKPTQTFWQKALFSGSQALKSKLYDVEGVQIGRLDLSTFDIKNADPSPLLFQTGYVTLKKISPDNKVFDQGYPNLEVKESFLNGLLSSYREIYPTGSMPVIGKVKNALKEGNVPDLIQQLNSLISTIPYDHWNAGTGSIFTVNVYLTFKLTGIDIYTEVHTARGRNDVIAKTDLYIFAPELKLDGSAQDAWTRLRQRAI